MKKIYTFWLTAFIMLMASFQAQAVLTLDLRWNNPGSIAVYVGGTGAGNKVSLPDDATQYTAVRDNTWGATYIAKTTGYEISSVTVGEDTLSPIGNGMYNIDMAKYDGQTVYITTEPIVYDSNFTIDVINGRDVLSVTMWGTGREIKVNTGLNTIPYSSKYEPGVDIQAVKPAEDAPVPVLTQDGVEMEWKAYYMWESNISHKYNGTSTKGFSFEDGKNFSVKYSDTPDETEATVEPAAVSLNFANSDARDALVMIFNITEMKSIEIANSFEVIKGDEIRLVFNTKDYVVNINGSELAGSMTDATTPYVFTADADKTLSISVSEREYGKTNVNIAISDLDGVVLREGSYNGPVIDKSSIVALGSSTYSYEDYNKVKKSSPMTTYAVEVSLKSPKVYVSEAEGYWFAACEYTDGSDKVPAGVATTEYTLNVVSKQIVANTELSVYVSVDGVNATIDNVVLRDRNRNEYALATGYNKVMIDPEYSSPLTASPFALEEGVAFAVFQDMAGISADSENENAYNMGINSDSAIHIFAGRAPAAEYEVSAYITPDASAEIVVDRIRKYTSSANISVFKGCEISVKPGDAPYMLDGEEAEYEGEAHVFKASDDHSIVIGNIALMEVTPNNTDAADFTNFVVKFPNATSAMVVEDMIADIVMSDNPMNHYAMVNFTVVEVAGANVPTFRIRPASTPTKGGNYRLVIPEGLFKLNAGVYNEEDIINFTLTANVNIEDVPVLFDPMVSTISQDDFYGINIMYGEEYGDYDLEVNDPSGIQVMFGGEEWIMGEDYGIELEANFIFIYPMNEISVAAPTEFSISYPAGTFLIAGVEALAFEHSWTIVPAKEYSVAVAPESFNEASDLKEIYISFIGAEKAEVAYPYGARLQHKDYIYSGIAVIEKIEPKLPVSDKDRAMLLGDAPTFKLTFDPTPQEKGTYTLTIDHGTFLLDDAYSSPEYEQVFSNVAASGVIDLNIDANGNVTVVDLNGRMVVRNQTSDAVKTLNKGIYIINGKKVVKE